ncbi:MAG: hypothetical protein R3C18_23295 [Planctomycetaceae bacterium]
MAALTRMDVINWADTKQCEGQLPELVRRLIVASHDSLEKIVMPFGDSVGRSGLDGFVRATSATAYVATGESVWEMGRNTGHTAKANDDFKKRTSRTSSEDQQNLSYYCITPRHWEKKTDWEKTPGPENEPVSHHWKSVHAYDVDDLIGWLADCPSVEAWFLRMIGKGTAGLRDVCGYWENVASVDSGAIGPEVLLAGREQVVQSVQSHFAENGSCPRPMAISSRTLSEVVPFAVASLVSSCNEVAIARAIVVESRHRWERIISEQSNLGLIVAPQIQPTREELQQSVSRNHRVVYCSTQADLNLPRLPEFEIRNALIQFGIRESDAHQHARQCGGSGQILLDRLSGLSPSTSCMGSMLSDRVKVACLLLGGWDGEHEADREVFSLLCGSRYEDVEPSLISDANDPNGLLFHAAGKYRLLSPELAWLQSARLITKTVSDEFADVVRYLLADDDPTAGMTGVERLTAQMLGGHPEFSRTLRRNVVHSLAIAGSIESPRLNLDPSMSPTFVNWIVRSVLEDASFARWASFGSELAILAEAAPDAVLDAVERDLDSGGPLTEVMANTEVDIFSSSPQVGVLWALEKICWSSEYLERATVILLRLAALNPELSSGNNPQRSIRETLQLACPQTGADWTMRRQTIEKLITSAHLDIAFPLVVSLFPSNQTMWMCRELPDWRDWASNYRRFNTYGQVALERRWCVSLLLKVAGFHTDRWRVLLELCGDVDDSQYTEILDAYETALGSDNFNDAAKRELWETINALLVRLDWAASRWRRSDGQVVDVDDADGIAADGEPHFPNETHRRDTFGPKLQELCTASIPGDPVLAECHAFLSGLGVNHCTQHFSNRFDYKKRNERIQAARLEVVENILSKQGITGLRRLAAITHVDANAVGRILASLDRDDLDFEEIAQHFSSTTESERLLARGYVAVWSWNRREALSIDVLPISESLPSDEAAASFLCCLPAGEELWNYVDQRNVTIQRQFWKNASVPWDIPAGRTSYLINNMIAAGCTDHAFDLLSRQDDAFIFDDPEPLFQALESLPKDTRGTDTARRRNLRWEIQKTLPHSLSNWHGPKRKIGSLGVAVSWHF